MNNPTIPLLDFTLSRRAFLHGGALVMTACASHVTEAAEALSSDPIATIGLVTDLHYAEKDPAMNRFYRESRAKFREAIDEFNKQKADFAIELGDFIDAADTVEKELVYLKSMEEEFARFKGKRHYVLGNHCVSTLNKKEFFEHTAADEGFYSFDQNGFHFVVLDACHRVDGVPYGRNNFVWTDSDIPIAQRSWLEQDLKKSNKPTIIFVHQRLDVVGDYAVKSAPAIRAVLEKSSLVTAVFQGHSHKNDYRDINGIHYCTLRALVEGQGPEQNGYGLLTISRARTLKLAGFRQQSSRELRSAKLP